MQQLENFDGVLLKPKNNSQFAIENCNLQLPCWHAAAIAHKVISTHDHSSQF